MCGLDQAYEKCKGNDTHKFCVVCHCQNYRITWLQKLDCMGVPKTLHPSLENIPICVS